jgi:hypothetical protein
MSFYGGNKPLEARMRIISDMHSLWEQGKDLHRT